MAEFVLGVLMPFVLDFVVFFLRICYLYLFIGSSHENQPRTMEVSLLYIFCFSQELQSF